MLKSAEINRLVRRILRELGLPQAEAQVFFLPNQELCKLKHTYFKKDVAYVDVLAFPEPKQFPHPESSQRVLGEVYLNRELRREPRELVQLLIHGILHLLGYRHQKKDDTIRMQRKAKQIWAQIS